jgi:superfamily II RNA helicase
LSYTVDALHRFHTFKDLFSLVQAGKDAKANASALRIELLKKHKVDEETNAESWMLSKKTRVMNALRDYISHETDISKELTAHSSFPKIHLMFHWAEEAR